LKIKVTSTLIMYYNIPSSCKRFIQVLS